MRRLTAMVVATCTIVIAAALAPSAFAWDGYPCGAQWYNSQYRVTVQTCPDYSPLRDNRIPVLPRTKQNSWPVGYINPSGNDWYECQSQGETHQLHNVKNNWWAWTVADNGARGWVAQTYFRGGLNFERDGNLRIC